MTKSAIFNHFNFLKKINCIILFKVLSVNMTLLAVGKILMAPVASSKYIKMNIKCESLFDAWKC